MRVPLHCVAPSLTNPRKTFDAARMQELADSIKVSGVHSPVLVRPLPASRVAKYVGKEGTVTAKTGPDAWDVTFKGRTGGIAGFHTTELQVVAATAA